MARTLVHRGPDGEGTWASPGGHVALGFRRLAILDLGPGGHQPMVSEDQRLALVFNGEIYNYLSLRAELEARGCSFRGTSDTEVLLHAFREWGVEATVPKLLGMFAIALWDDRDRLLYLVRDRLGKKPLYYGWQQGAFLFGSELKALRAHPAFHAEIDRTALARYLRFSCVPGPASIYEGILKLQPASWLCIRADMPGIHPPPHRYWDAAEVARKGQQDPLRLSDQEATRELEVLLSDAVRRRLVADVPVGAFLSGGIDSSTVVALMQASGTHPRTFTVGFSAGEYDESHYAAAVARHLGCEHTELQVTPTEARAVIPGLPALYDEPFADSSQIPTFLVSQLARRQVVVALSGDGGDEVFGGYHRYVSGTSLWSALERIPRPLRASLSRLLASLPPRAWDGLGRAVDRAFPSLAQGLLTGNRVQKLASVLDAVDIDALYLRLVSTWADPQAPLISGNIPPQARSGMLDPSFLSSPAHRMMLADLVGYLPDDILVKLDRASMGAGLEARAPLLDHRVVEFAWRLPHEMKIRGKVGKWLLRQVLQRYVPRAMVERPKQGFGVPIDEWLRGPLREWAEDLLSERVLKRGGFFSPSVVRDALREHLSGTKNRQHELWAVLMFQAWMESLPQHARQPSRDTSG